MTLWALSVGNAFRAGGLLLAATALWYLYRGYCVRSRFQRLQRQGTPMLPHHPLLGHLGVVGKLMADMPRDAHGDYLMVLIQDRWRELFPPAYDRCPPAVYLDLWPASPPMLLSLDPAVSAQFTQDANIDKSAAQATFLWPLTGNLDVASSHGAAWKRLRRRLNPGFSPQAIRQQTPALLEEVEVFRDVLFKAAGRDGAWGPVFALEEKVTMLTLDFIGRFTLDARLHEQTTPLTPATAAMLDTLPWLTIHVHIGNVLSLLNPWRQLKLRRNRRTMDGELRPLLAARRAAVQASAEKKSGAPLVDTLFQAIADDPDEADADAALEYVVAETKHTLFAGHETTAFSLAWLFQTLARQPAILAAVCAEHDAVLGPDPAAAADRLRAAPHLLGQLAYTTAVIKETMRVHTNVGTLRAGRPGFALYGPPGCGAQFEGVAFPTEGCVLWDGNFAIHRNPALWPRPLEVVPERWLTSGDASDPLHPARNAYRPFEQGARNCIGQHLAMTEMTMVLALVVRELEVAEAWEAWDAQKPRSRRKETVWGERLYQVSQHGPPHVKDGMPVRVRLRGGARVGSQE